MKNYVIIFLSIFLACKESGKTNLSQLSLWTLYSSDSFQFQQQKAYLQVFKTDKEDRFPLVCRIADTILLDANLEAPPGEVEAVNIFGDSLPEIVVNDCLGCDLGRIRFFFFDKNKNQFSELKGTSELLSDIYSLNGIDLIYNVACFNQGGCESNLIKVVGDTCYKLAEIFVPYSEAPVKLTKSSMPQQIDLVEHPIEMDTDSLIPFLWRKYIRD